MAKAKLEDMGKTIQIKECVMDKLEIIQTSLAPELQEIYDAGFCDGVDSREAEIEELTGKVLKLQNKINAFIKALEENA